MIINLKANDPTETVLEVIKENKPRTVAQLTLMLKENLNLPETEILKLVLKLQAQGKIKFEDQGQVPRSLEAYANNQVFGYLLTIVTGAITVALVFAIPENLYPWIYSRNFFGVIFVLFLPGYTFAKVLFPIVLPDEISSAPLEIIERIALSVALSIALVSIIGLILYYSPLGLGLYSIIPSLFVFTAVFATASVFRKQHIGSRQV